MRHIQNGDKHRGARELKPVRKGGDQTRHGLNEAREGLRRDTDWTQIFLHRESRYMHCVYAFGLSRVFVYEDKCKPQSAVLFADFSESHLWPETASERAY